MAIETVQSSAFGLPGSALNHIIPEYLYSFISFDKMINN